MAMTDKLRRKLMSEAEQTAAIDLNRRMIAASSLCALAKALLLRLHNMTAEEFSRDEECTERRALHAELVRLGVMEFDGNRIPAEEEPMTLFAINYSRADPVRYLLEWDNMLRGASRWSLGWYWDSGGASQSGRAY